MIKSVDFNVTIGYEMSRSECEEEMRKVGAVWEDYDDEVDCFKEMVENRLSCGLGAFAIVNGKEEG